MTETNYNFTPGEAAHLSNVCLATLGSGWSRKAITPLSKSELADLVVSTGAKPVGKSAVDKIIGEKIVRVVKRRGVQHPARNYRHIDSAAVLFLVSSRLVNVRLYKSQRIEIYKWFTDRLVDEDSIESANTNRLALSPALIFEPGDAVFKFSKFIRRYAEARDSHIHSDPEIMGGTPVIRGTRISVYSILARVDGGEALQDLYEDYPKIPQKAFNAAIIYARTHPRQGRRKSLRESLRGVAR